MTAQVIRIDLARRAGAQRCRRKRDKTQAQQIVAFGRLALSVMESASFDLESLFAEVQLALSFAERLARSYDLGAAATAFRRGREAVEPVLTDGLVDMRRFVEGGDRDDIVADLVTALDSLEERTGGGVPGTLVPSRRSRTR